MLANHASGLTLFLSPLAPIRQSISQSVPLFMIVDLDFQVIRGEAESWGCLCWRGEGTGGLYQCVQMPSGGSQEREARLFSAVPGDEAVGTLKCKKFHLNLRNAFPTVRVIKRRSRLSERLWSLNLGDLQNPVAGHAMSSEQGARLDDVHRCLPTSALLWRKQILQFAVEAIQNKPIFAVC